MFLHIGEDTVVLKKDIVMITDMDGLTVSGISREFLRRAEADGNITAISTMLPKSIVVTSNNRIYLSPVSLSTLLKKSTL